MKKADIVIVGGGMVGLALAALLADTKLQIKVIEKNKTIELDPTRISNRVSAINFSSQAMLEKIGAWQKIASQRLSPYSQMYVWEKDSFAKIHFDNQDPTITQLGLEQLGHIVENGQIQSAIWKVVEAQHNVEIILDQPKKLDITDDLGFVTLESGEMISAKLVVGADGANSWVRRQVNFPLISRDYEHTALVCNVKTSEPHQQTARQIFAKDSILAFLPLPNENLCSIVWSLPPEKAKSLVNCDEKEFNQALTIAFDNRLGVCELQSERAIYPLTARYARNFAQQRVVVVGDAAHTIHPLAGLGVNLGFADVITLANELKYHLALEHDIGDYRYLRQFERKRKVEAAKVLFAMGSLKSLFSGEQPIKKLIRGIGLSLADKSAEIKKLFIQQTLGF
ncbi:FAD-dependent monooxygenase [Otariodibacter oris]|uniref:2-octaprenylphenol hydroxylase n=1 Tax=Otariodibacter oris TaxID=1032623 RepID=A0A420XHL7_9PAST|nr:FAD-dependent monooxygenase [Otariodibacter oris]QGM80979.1 FAD-dependent 2-octaprenylphenol hydroxylase [Otariodibacter oris]RKR76842.1 2-octaprenylphenol hydroxylase [Otariodibacter oris]